VIDKLDRQLLKHKEIIQDHHHDKNKVQSLS
jgi:ribosome-associated translation inhibitor RaiA